MSDEVQNVNDPVEIIPTDTPVTIDELQEQIIELAGLVNQSSQQLARAYDHINNLQGYTVRTLENHAIQLTFIDKLLFEKELQADREAIGKGEFTVERARTIVDTIVIPYLKQKHEEAQAAMIEAQAQAAAANETPPQGPPENVLRFPEGTVIDRKG
jgi:hypothetical protein